jgi:hypothetical protein
MTTAPSAVSDCTAKPSTFGPTVVDRWPPILADYASIVPIVVIGRVVSMGRATWSTPDGSEPDLASHDAINFHIFRPVTVDIEESVKGDPTAELNVNLWGGKARCVTYDPGWVLPLEMANGSTWALLVDGSPDGRNGEMTDDLMIIEAWPVTASGIVKTPLDGDLSLAAFESAVKAAGDAP